MKKTFRDRLIDEFQLRKETSSFSLRAFAEMLEIEPSFLSKLLSGKRAATASVISRLGAKMGWPPEDIEKYQIDFLKASRPQRRHATSAPHFNWIDFQKASSLARWYYFALLELLNLPQCDGSLKQISEKLGIERGDAAFALKRLKQEGLLESDDDKTFKLTSANNAIAPSPFTAPELRALQREFLVKSQLSLEEDDLEFRDHSGITLSIPKSRVAEAKKLIKVFRRRFMRQLEKYDGKDSVYQLTISFFPLSKLRDGNVEGKS